MKKVLHILTHSIEPYNLTPILYSNYDAYPHSYCKIASHLGYTPILAYLSLSVKNRLLLTHKYGHTMIAYPVNLNGGRFGYEVSRSLVEDVLRCSANIIHVHSYYLLMYDLIALTKKISNKPVIAHYHGGTPDMLLLPFRAPKKVSLFLADKVITINKTELNRLQDYWKVPLENIEYVPNGVNTDLFKPLSDVKKNKNEILFVGNLVKEKGIELAVSSFIKCKREFNDLKLTLVGQGYMKPAIEEKIKRLGITKDVTFLVTLNHKQLNVAYNKATITIFPSKKEGLPLALLESMSSGTPVVTAINDGSRDIVSNRVDGLLINQEGTKAFSEAISDVLSNTHLQTMFGRNSRKKVVENFSQELVSKRIKQIYESLS